MVTIDDVAKKAGVSKATVSSVFSKKRPISKNVTERVLHVAKELNYMPNHVARSLATKKTMIIGLKMPMREFELSSFENKVINGVVTQCTKHGYRVLLDRINDDMENDLMSKDPVDGIILYNLKNEDEWIEQLKRTNIPFVLIGRPNEADRDTKFVGNNNVEIVKEVVEFLIEKGHQDILFLNSALGMTVTEDRKEGLKQAFENYSLPFREEAIVYNDPNKYEHASDYGYQATLERLESDKRYTAIIAETDRAAFGVLRAVRRLGVNIPNDLSLVALSNNETIASETNPRLTGVELFPEKLGEEAAKIVVNMLNNQLVPREKIVPAKLIERNSCTPNQTNFP